MHLRIAPLLWILGNMVFKGMKFTHEQSQGKENKRKHFSASKEITVVLILEKHKFSTEL